MERQRALEPDTSDFLPVLTWLGTLVLMLVLSLLAGCVDDSTPTGDTNPPAGMAPPAGMPSPGQPPAATPPADPAPVPPAGTPPAAAPTLTDLGRALFHDAALSSTGTQSCASCHAAPAAFTDPDQQVPVSEGAISGVFGARNTPTAQYTTRVPALALRNTATGARWSGGLFVDGRAATLQAQARAPFFNAREMNLANAADLLTKLRSSPSRAIYEAVFGADSLASGVAAAAVVTRVTNAIAAWERTAELSPYASKFDAERNGTAQFTAQETQGRDIFLRRDKGNCAACHALAADANGAIAPGANGAPPVFSNFQYENIGVPRNPDRRFFAADSIDTGLEATLLGRGIAAEIAARERGKFRVPTLRNVARTAPYMHNGVFSDLKTVVEFYNTRDADRGRWLAIGETEVPATVERRLTGNLRLNAQEVDALVAFLQTLNDGAAP